MVRSRRIVVDSSDDEFPDLRDIASFKANAFNSSVGSQTTRPAQPPTKSAVRRRKLGAITDNPLLRPWGDRTSSTPAPKYAAPEKTSTAPQRVELRTKKTKPVVTSVEIDDDSEEGSVQEETIIEDFSEDDEGSDFEGSESSASEAEDDGPTFRRTLQRSPSKSKKIEKPPQQRRSSGEERRSPSPSAQLLAEAIQAEERNRTRRYGSSEDRKPKSNGFSSQKTEMSKGPPSTADLVDPLRRLQL